MKMNFSVSEDENMDRSQCQVFLKISHNSIQQKLNVFVGKEKSIFSYFWNTYIQEFTLEINMFLLK